jgi:hypothetical protein
MVDIAGRGLRERGQGEEVFLQPLRDRLQEGRCPADETELFYRRGGVDALVKDRAL